MSDLEQEIRRAKPEYERMPTAFKARLRNQIQAQARPSRLRHIGWIGSVAGVAALVVVALFGSMLYMRPLEEHVALTEFSITQPSIIEPAPTPTQPLPDVLALFNDQVKLVTIEFRPDEADATGRIPLVTEWFTNNEDELVVVAEIHSMLGVLASQFADRRVVRIPPSVGRTPSAVYTFVELLDFSPDNGYLISIEVLQKGQSLSITESAPEFDVSQGKTLLQSNVWPYEPPELRNAVESATEAIAIAERVARDGFVQFDNVQGLSAENHPLSTVNQMLFGTTDHATPDDKVWLVRYHLPSAVTPTIYYAHLIDAESAEMVAFYQQAYPFEAQYAPIVRDKQLIQHAHNFASVEFKPVAAGALHVEYATSITQLKYETAIDLLGQSAIATYHGSNIIDMHTIIDLPPVTYDDTVWFAQIVGEFGLETERPQYYAVVMHDDGSVVAAGSATRPIIDEARTVRGRLFGGAEQSLKINGQIVLSDERGDFAFELSGSTATDIALKDLIITVPEGAGTLYLGTLPFSDTKEKIVIVNNMRDVGIHYIRDTLDPYDFTTTIWLVQTLAEIIAFPTSSPFSDDPDCRISSYQAYLQDTCSDARWNMVGVALGDPPQPDLTRYEIKSDGRIDTIVLGETR